MLLCVLQKMRWEQLMALGLIGRVGGGRGLIEEEEEAEEEEEYDEDEEEED